jgi:hypothetical protein
MAKKINKAMPQKVSTKTPLSSKKDTTKIAKPYKITKKELPTPGGLLSPFVADSTRKKIAYNLGTAIPSLVKRNSERKAEGKKAISYKSISGGAPLGFSNTGESFSKSPLQRVKQKSGEYKVVKKKSK